MNDTVSLGLEEVHRLTFEIFSGHGVSEAQSRAVADVVTAAERDGCKSHGLFRVPSYIASVRSGKMRRDAEPLVTDLAPGVLRVDAGEGFAPLALETGRGPLVEKARNQGIALLAVVNSLHFQAVWYEVEALAEQGLAALACVTTASYVAPAGGTRPLYGTNPLAFGWPRPGRPPLVFDQASSASARGEIMLHERDGHPIPEGWAIDEEGRPTTDPSAALRGAQLAFGGYKGAAIALMVELLAGALIGDLFSFEVSERDNNDGGPMSRGEIVIAIDPARTVPDGDRERHLAHAERLFERILDEPGARLPSDRRYAERLRSARGGIEIPAALHVTLEGLRHGGS